MANDSRMGTTKKNGSSITLARSQSPYNDIFVIERENLREMWFQGEGQFYLQSRMDLDRPQDLALVYVRLLLAPLLWNPEPSRILVVGLGAGTLPRFLHAVYPHLAIDVVEVDARVTELARQYFDFRESPRLRVTEDDGRAFIQRQNQKYDIVVLDAFKGGSVPYHLKTVEFYREIARSLKTGGLLATNLYGKSNSLKPRDRTTLDSVFHQVTMLEDSDRVATVCVASRQGGGVSEAMFRAGLGCLPENVLRHLSWFENVDMIKTGKGFNSVGSIFEDDFKAAEFFRAAQRNNRSEPLRDPPYPIRNSS